MASARLCRKRCYRNIKSNAIAVVQIWQTRKRQCPFLTHIITYTFWDGMGWGSKKQPHLSVLSHSYACLLILLILLWSPDSTLYSHSTPCVWVGKLMGLTELFGDYKDSL